MGGIEGTKRGGDVGGADGNLVGAIPSQAGARSAEGGFVEDVAPGVAS